jgi:hypothetical protein
MANTSEIRFCAYCGGALTSSGKFCPQCGQMATVPSGAQTKAEEADPTPEEGAGILAEMANMEKFFLFCTEHPDEAMHKITRFVKVNPDTEGTGMILIYRFVVFGQKAKQSYESHGKTCAPETVESCVRCLSEYAKARSACLEEGSRDVVPLLDELMDEVAVILAKSEPERIQQLTGSTKLKYLLHGDRVSVSNAAKNMITGDELREIFTLTVKTEFIIRSAMFATVLGSGDGRSALIMLYDEPDIWDFNEKLKKSKGMLYVTCTGGSWRTS